MLYIDFDLFILTVWPMANKNHSDRQECSYKHISSKTGYMMGNAKNTKQNKKNFKCIYLKYNTSGH